MTYKSELATRLEELPEITLTSVHLGIEESVFNKDEKVKWLRDNFTITISYNGKSYSTSYSMGIGHRKLIRSVKKEGNRYWESISGQFYTEMEACKAQWLKLVEPNLADVMHCLLLDGRCSEGTFEDFCSELGYDSDSRKALETYLACQANGNGILKVIGRELFNELSQLEH